MPRPRDRTDCLHSQQQAAGSLQALQLSLCGVLPTFDFLVAEVQLRESKGGADESHLPVVIGEFTDDRRGRSSVDEQPHNPNRRKTGRLNRTNRRLAKGIADVHARGAFITGLIFPPLQ